MKKCPNCQKEIPNDSRFCQFCGRKLIITGSPIKKKNKWPIIAIIGLSLLFICCIVGAGGVYGWYYYLGPCGTISVNNATKKFDEIASRESNVITALDNSIWKDFPGHMAELESLSQDTQDLEVPSCLTSAKDSLVESMGHTIDAYQAYAAQEDNSVVNDQKKAAYDDILLFAARYAIVKMCAPFCSESDFGK